MTVKDLRNLLFGVPGDTPVVVVVNTLTAQTEATSGADYIAGAASFVGGHVQIVLQRDLPTKLDSGDDWLAARLEQGS